MATVKVLIPGHTSEDSANENPDEPETTCATISLVRDNDLIMVIDPGVLESQQQIIDALKKEGLTIQDITHVCITHSHIDHYRNIGMFPTAKTLEYYGLWDKNMVEDYDEQFTENIKVIKTPGHDSTSITLLIKTDQGVVAICGDVFWKEEGPVEDPYASRPKKLKESREKVLKLADYIVPGHADMYKVKK